MPYNFTNFTNANTTLEQVIEIDQNFTGGVFSLLIIAALFIVLFVRFLPYSPFQAFAGASFISSILSALFWIAGFVDLIAMIVTLIMTVSGIVLMIFLDK